jgi:hypothetical protein
LNATTGVITGTVTASCAGTYTPTFTVMDSGTPTKLKASTQLTITLTAAPAITFGSAPASTGTFNVAYSSAATASGGVGALSYSLASGNLPANLTLSGSGAIAGTPKAADVGTWNFAVKAADAFGDSTTSAGYSLVISYPQLSVTTTTLSSAYGSVAYSQTLAASGGNGGPYTWTVTSGAASLTALNLSLSSAGVLSGTPPVAGGTANFTVQAADSASNTGTQALTLTIKPGVTVTTASPLPGGYGNAAYSQTLAASGGSGTPYTWTVTSGASSLSALNLSLSSSGVLSGTPPFAGGSASFSVQAKDSANNTAAASYTLSIGPGVTVTAPTLSAAYPGTPYASPAFTAAGGTNTGYTWTMTPAGGSSIPAGYSIGSATGIIGAASPVNSNSTSATYNVVVTATDSLGNPGSVNATLTILGTVTITTTPTLPAGTTGVNYSQSLAAAGGVGPYTWQQVSSTLGTLGLSFSTSTGVVSGSSPTLGTASLTVTAKDNQNHISSPVTFSVTVSNQLKIDQTTLTPGNVGTSYSQSLTASGGSGSGYTFAETTNNLSGYGLSLSGGGSISGTPTQTGTVSFTARVIDSASNTATQNLSIQVYSGLTLPSSNSLPSGYTGVAYSGTVTGTGGSGNLSASITSTLAPSNGTLTAGAGGASVSITGTPTSPGTESIGVRLTDNTTNASITQSYTFNISTATAPSLPTPGSTVPGSGTVGQSFNGTISLASGATQPYSLTWTVNGSAVPSNGSQVSLGASGLYVSTSGGTTLTVGDTPVSTGQVQFTVQVKDNNTGLTSSTQTYTIQVNQNGSQITGQINWASSCGVNPALPTFNVAINTTPVQTVPTDTNGNFTFTGVANGSYTIQPSYSGPSGSSAVFYPATQSVTVSGSNLSNQSFQTAIGYTVAGTVSYGGSHGGRIYVDLVNNNCSGNGGSGTSITSAGSYTIRGVQPGNYTLTAWMDVNDSSPDGYNLGEGVLNKSDPLGTTAVTVGTGNVSSANVTVTDNNPASAPTSTPKINVAFGTHSGFVISYSPVIGSSDNIEAATSYDVAWSTSAALSGGSLASVAGTMNFKAAGKGTSIWTLNNFVTGTSAFSDGTTYYLQTRANNAAGHGSWAVYGGSTPTSVTAGPPSAANTITGNITIPAGVTLGSHAVLYAGFFSNTGGIYASVIASPVVGANAFSVNVPNGNWQFFEILDQNNDGLVDAGDITNVRGQNGPPAVTISGSSTQNLTLSATNMVAAVQTQFQQVISSGGTSSGYVLSIGGREGARLPVSVQLTAASNPNVIVPMDISNYCQGCGNISFQFAQGIGGATPSVGDTYTFNVTYSDGTQDTGVTATVTGWNGGATVVGPSHLPGNLSPTGTSSTSTTPTFTWTDASAATASTDLYSFYIYASSGSCTGSCNLWQIPGDDSSTNGFPSSITSITWGTDPTGEGSTPSVGSLTAGTVYNWTISVQDANGNQAQTQTWYQP